MGWERNRKETGLRSAEGGEAEFFLSKVGLGGFLGIGTHNLYTRLFKVEFSSKLFCRYSSSAVFT